MAFTGNSVVIQEDAKAAKRSNQLQSSPFIFKNNGGVPTTKVFYENLKNNFHKCEILRSIYDEAT